MTDKNYDWGDVDGTDQLETHASYLDAATAYVADHPAKVWWYRMLDPKPGSRILDVGCGLGDDVMELAQIVGPEGLVVGIDKSEGLIEKARQRSKEYEHAIEFHVEDAHQLSFENNTFDGCTASRVFMHLPDRQKVLSEMIRVTRTGGRIVVGDPDWDTLIVEVPDMILTRKILYNPSNQCVNPWAGREHFKLFKEAGLVEISVDPATIAITDYALADQLFNLEQKALALGEAGIISLSDTTKWVDYLKQADQAGYFFCALTGYNVAGKKP